MTVVWTPPLSEEEHLCLWFAERSNLSLELVAAALAVPSATVEYILGRARALRDQKMALDPGSVPPNVWPLDRISDMPPSWRDDAASSSVSMATSPRGS